MLIVNADDFGFSVTTTNPAVNAWEAGFVSSASAMVWMRDSPRAARLARERGIPLGLHLNLTFPFKAPDVPAHARELQLELTRMFDPGSWDEDRIDSTRPDARIREAIGHQLQAFREIYGEPTHIDGHHHVHVNAKVLASLPRDFPIRPVLRAPTDLRRPLKPRERWLRNHFRAADACVSFQHVHPMLGGSGLSTLDLARRRVLEVMVHPQIAEEREALRTPEWAQALASLPLGSYRDLKI